MPRRMKTLQRDQELHCTAFGLVLTAALDQRGWTQQEFGSKTSLGQSTISRICNGKQVPDLLHVIRIEEALGVTPGTILAALPAAYRTAQNILALSANRHGVPVI